MQTKLTYEQQTINPICWYSTLYLWLRGNFVNFVCFVLFFFFIIVTVKNNNNNKQRRLWLAGLLSVKNSNDGEKELLPKGDVTWDDSQRRCLAQHSDAMLEQCWKYSKQCRNNVVMLRCAKTGLLRIVSSNTTLWSLRATFDDDTKR